MLAAMWHMFEFRNECGQASTIFFVQLMNTLGPRGPRPFNVEVGSVVGAIFFWNPSLPTLKGRVKQSPMSNKYIRTKNIDEGGSRIRWQRI